MIQSCQGLDEHIDTFVSVFISTCSEEVESVVWLKVVVAVEMTSNEVVNLLFRLLVQVLEFVHSRELLDVQAIGQNSVRLTLQQMLTLVRSDVRDGRKDIRSMCSCTFDAVSVINTALARFGIDVKVLKVVVKVNRAGAEISTQKSCVGGEDGSDIYPSFFGQRKGYTCKPLVEVRNDSPLLLV